LGSDSSFSRLLTLSRRKLIAALGGIPVAARAEPVYGRESIYTRMFGLRPLLCARGDLV
jgi:hypothetical protein